MKDTNHPLLETFKKRMRIFHDSEDDNLVFILKSSEEAIRQQTGIVDVGSVSFQDLVIERSRYAYNDQVEFFYENFQNDILRVSFQNYETEETDES